MRIFSSIHGGVTGLSADGTLSAMVPSVSIGIVSLGAVRPGVEANAVLTPFLFAGIFWGEFGLNFGVPLGPAATMTADAGIDVVLVPGYPETYARTYFGASLWIPSANGAKTRLTIRVHNTGQTGPSNAISLMIGAATPWSSRP